MRKGNKVIFFLRIPPPIGGGEIVSEMLYLKIKNIPQFYFVLFSRKRHNKSLQAKTTIIGFLHGFGYILKCILNIIYRRPHCIYIGLPKSFYGYFRNFIVIYFAKTFNIEVIAEFHGMSFPFIVNSAYKRRLLLATINKIDKIRVLSKGIKDYYINLGFKNTLYIIDNGLDIPAEKPRKKTNQTKFKILYIGAISEKKGFTRLLNLMYRLKQSKLDIEFHVAGEWVNLPYKEGSLKWLSDKGLINNVIFHGIVMNNEKRELFRKSDILVHLTEFDGQPLTIIEAFAFGIPVIATRVGGIPEMIENGYNGYLVSDEWTAYSKVIKLITDPKLLNSMSINAMLAYQKKYTSEIMANGIISMIYD